MSNLEEGYGEEDENWEEEAFLEGMEEAEFGKDSETQKKESLLGDLEDEFSELEEALEEEFSE